MASSLSLTAPVSPTLSGLSAYGSIGAVNLVWDKCLDPLYSHTEVYGALGSNDLNSAGLLATVKDNSLTWPVSTNYIMYFWIRAIDIHGRTLGDWYPSNAYSGVAGTPNAVDAADIGITSGSVDLSPATDLSFPADVVFASSTAFNGGDATFNVPAYFADTHLYGDCDMDSTYGTFKVNGGAAVTLSTTVDTASTQLNPGASVQTLVTYNLTGNGFPVLLEWSDFLSSGAAATPWGTLTLGTSTYISLQLSTMLRNTTDGVDIEGQVIDYVSYYNGAQYLFNPQPYFKTLQPLAAGKSYTYKVYCTRVRGGGNGTATGLYSIDRILKTMEMRI